MKKCAYCGRDNPDNARQCHECGTAFENGAKPGKTKRSPGAEKMRCGSVWIAGGVLVASLTYRTQDIAPGNGTYVVAWGLLVFGALEFCKGLSMAKAPPPGKNALNEDLAAAAKLQAAGQLQEALALYQKIAAESPDSAAGREARIGMENLKANAVG